MGALALERERPGATPERFAEHLKAEAARVWELYQQGTVREVHFRDDRTDAVLILECADVDSARAALDTLPLVQAGLVEFEVIGLRPYPGFARLFAAGETARENSRQLEQR